MRRLTILLCFIFSLCTTTLRAEEFVAKYATYEKDGQRIELSDTKLFPSFNAEYKQRENIVILRSSAGNLILTKATYGYSYSGIHKGIAITATAYLTNGKITKIVYEEYDKVNKMKAKVDYYKR